MNSNSLLISLTRQLTSCFACRHPLDQQNTRLLKILPGLGSMARNLLGMFVWNLAVLSDTFRDVPSLGKQRLSRFGS